MLTIKYVSQFKKDMKKYQHKATLLSEIHQVLQLLVEERDLPVKYHDHGLIGTYVGMRECHIKPDLLLIYWIDKKNSHLVLERLGSHSALFE